MTATFGMGDTLAALGCHARTGRSAHPFAEARPDGWARRARSGLRGALPRTAQARARPAPLATASRSSRHDRARPRKFFCVWRARRRARSRTAGTSSPARRRRALGCTQAATLWMEFRPCCTNRARARHPRLARAPEQLLALGRLDEAERRVRATVEGSRLPTAATYCQSRAIRTAAATANGTATSAISNPAPSSDRCGAADSPERTASTAPAPKISTGT